MQPTKLTDDVRSALSKAVRNGLTRRLSAAAAGIAESTLYEWLRKGKEDEENGVESEYKKLRTAIKQAESKHAQECLEIISQAAIDPRNWTAAAWLLERRHKDYAKTERLEQHHTGAMTFDTGNDAIRDRINQILGNKAGEVDDGDSV